MSKDDIKSSIKTALADRQFLIVLVALVIFGLGYSIFATLSLHAPDIQVYTHYTAFGEGHFYKGRWYTLIELVSFGVLVTLVNSALMVKIYSVGRRQSALLVGVATMLIFVIAGFYAHSIFQLAFR